METLTESQIEIPVVAEQAPPVRKSSINDWFTPNFIEMMKVSVNEPMVRGWMLRTLTKMPPASADTFEKVVDWIEFNMERKQAVRVATPARQTDTFEVGVCATGRERGRCSYSVNTYGSATIRVDMDRVKEFIEDAFDRGDSTGEIIERLTEEIGDGVWDDLSLEADGDSEYSYDDYSSDDSDNNGWEYDSTSDVKRRLLQVAATMNEDIREYFGV